VLIEVPPGYRAIIRPVSEADRHVLEAVDRVWSKIQEQAPAVPNVIFDLTPGRSSGCSDVGWDQPHPVISINLRPDGPRRRTSTGPEILQGLLHQAAHAIVYEPGKIAPTEGRYHSREYKEAAERLGLDVEPSDPVGKAASGWSVTTLARGTLSRYRSEVDRLSRALAKWEPTAQQKTQQPRESRTQVAVHCSCTPPRKIRAGQKVLDKGGIRCEVCGELFLPAS
jgi:hypothetical protein